MKKSKRRALRISSSNANTHSHLIPVSGRAELNLSGETQEQRVSRLHASGGGPLIGWLLDEARVRGWTFKALAAELGVTYGYINQLRGGIRDVSQVSTLFAKRAARFLGVPPVVVKLMTGQLDMSDFMSPQQTEEEFVEHALCRMMRDPKAGMFVSLDLLSADLGVKKDFLALYAEVSGDDIYGMQELPEIVRSLQRAALVHSKHVQATFRGQENNKALALAG